MTTMYHLDLKQGEVGSGATSVLAALVTEDAAVMAATLRAVADRLDPLQPVRPVYRDQPGVTRGWTSTSGPLADPDADRRREERDAARQAAREYFGGARPATPAQIDAMVCPDCFGDRHTYELGKCALKPPWNRAGVPVGTVGEPAPNGFAVVGYEDATPVVVDAPGARMDAPDAVLSPAAAEVVARVEADQDEAIMARMRQRLTPATGPKAGASMPRSRGSRITPDGCGPEHTFTGSCALTPPHRD